MTKLAEIEAAALRLAPRTKRRTASPDKATRDILKALRRARAKAVAVARLRKGDIVYSEKGRIVQQKP